MTLRARVDTDVIFHNQGTTSFTVGALSEHTMGTATSCSTVAGTVGTAAVTIVGATPVSTIAVKNTGTGVLRLAGAIDVPAGRVAVIPTTATFTLSAPSGTGAYSVVWVG
jgi:hypothetical protein